MMVRGVELVLSVLLAIHLTNGELCSSLKPDEILQCENNTISKSACEEKGCCWNEEKLNNFTCYRSKHQNGTCIQYPEDGICFKYLNASVPQFRNTPRFIDYNIGLNKTNELLAKFHNIIDVVVAKEISETCLRTVRILLCQYILTPCLDDGSFVQICREDCDMYEKECPMTLPKLVGAATIVLGQTNMDFGHISLPNCENLAYAKDLNQTGKQCYQTGLFNETKLTKGVPSVPVISTKHGPTSESPSDDKTAIIVSVVVVIPVLIVAFLLGVLFYRRRKNRKEQAKLDLGKRRMNLRGQFPAVSVKDHINKMLSADDLLKSKMPINDVKLIKQFSVDKVAYERDLGEGQFGQVFQGRAVGLNEEKPEEEVIVAVKTLKKGSSPQTKADFDQEACLMNYLCHPNIVRLLAVSAIEEPYCMIFEFMSNGDLSEYLRKSQPLEENEYMNGNKNQLSQETLIQMCIDIAKGLEYLASHRLIHRDVATRNCLVADDLTIKIADFGMSRDIYSNNYYKIERDTVLPIRWLSPEAVLFGRFTVQSDIYSYGVLLWEIFTFSLQPFYGYTNKQVIEFIKQGIHLAKPDYCPDFVYRIMKTCWSDEPELRPYYDKIIDALNGEDLIIEKPKESELADTQPMYQNFIPNSNNVDVASNSSQETYTDPLMKSQGDSPGHKNRSTTPSEGSVNSGMNLQLDDERRSSNQPDYILSRMNKTYV